MSIQDPGNRPTGWGVAGDHERRIRALEALQPCCDDSGGPFSSYRDCVLSQNPVAYWPLDEDSGDVTDIVGGEILLATTGGGFPVYGDPGPFVTPTAIRFGGSEGTGIFGGHARFQKNVISTDVANAFTGPFTVEFWAYIIAYSAVDHRRIFQYWVESGANAFVIQVTTTGEIQAAKDGASVYSDPSMPLNAWTHVRVTFDGTDLGLWIDTVQVDSIAAPGSISGGPFIIGNQEESTDFWRPFSGRLSDFAVYDYSLTDFCDLVTTDGPGSASASEGMVLTADGSGGTYWAYPTIEVLADGV